MPDKAWKKFERRVAAFFNGERNALSGRNAKVTGGDVIHPDLYIECKQRQNPAIWSLWADTRAQAVKEDKTPVVCVAKKNHAGFLIVVHCDDLAKL